MTGTVAFNLQFPLGYSRMAAFKKPLTVFCDFDGPLVDVSDRYYSTYKLALEQTQAFYQAQGETLQLHPLTKDQFWQMKQERVRDDEIAMRSGLRGKEIDEFLNDVHQIVNQPTLLHKDKVHSGVNWALALLHSQGVQLVLVTLRCKGQAIQILRNYGLERLFSGIYGVEEDRYVAYQNNIDAKTALLKQAMADFSPVSACMIGDTEADIVSAEILGIPSIALTCGIRSRTYLEKLQPTHIYPDLLCASHQLVEAIAG